MRAHSHVAYSSCRPAGHTAAKPHDYIIRQSLQFSTYSARDQLAAIWRQLWRTGQCRNLAAVRSPITSRYKRRRDNQRTSAQRTNDAAPVHQIPRELLFLHAAVATCKCSNQSKERQSHRQLHVAETRPTNGHMPVRMDSLFPSSTRDGHARRSTCRALCPSNAQQQPARTRTSAASRHKRTSGRTTPDSP